MTLSGRPNFSVGVFRLGLNGFRFGKRDWEIAFGPSITLRSTAYGFYDTDNLMAGTAGEWYLEYEWIPIDPVAYPQNPYYNNIVERMDSRGDVSISTGWVWAIGKTFRSGYLNIPVNIYVSPNKEGWYTGLSVGFNTSRKR